MRRLLKKLICRIAGHNWFVLALNPTSDKRAREESPIRSFWDPLYSSNCECMRCGKVYRGIRKEEEERYNRALRMMAPEDDPVSEAFRKGMGSTE